MGKLIPFFAGTSLSGLILHTFGIGGRDETSFTIQYMDQVVKIPRTMGITRNVQQLLDWLVDEELRRWQREPQ